MHNNDQNQDPNQIKNNKLDPKARHNARHYAVQALYQHEIAKTHMNDIENEFINHQIDKRIDLAYFKELIHGTKEQQADLDNEMMPHLGRPFEEIDAIELSVMRLAIYELKHRPDVPYKVVINEALELTKKFGSVEGFKFVNGVLDRVAKKIRITEIK